MFASGHHIAPWDAGFKVSHTHVAMVQSSMPTRNQANHDFSSRIILRLQNPSGPIKCDWDGKREALGWGWGGGMMITAALTGKFQNQV